MSKPTFKTRRPRSRKPFYLAKGKQATYTLNPRQAKAMRSDGWRLIARQEYLERKASKA